MRPVNRLIIIIGALAILAGMYLALNGADWEDYFLGIFIGITLIGTAYYQGLRQKKKQE